MALLMVILWCVPGLVMLGWLASSISGLTALIMAALALLLANAMDIGCIIWITSGKLPSHAFSAQQRPLLGHVLRLISTNCAIALICALLLTSSSITSDAMSTAVLDFTLSTFPTLNSIVHEHWKLLADHLYVIFLLPLVLFLSLYYYASQHTVPSANWSLSVASDPPVLYLRSFDKEDKIHMFSDTLGEPELHQVFSRIGPVVAIGRPDSLPPPYITRFYVEDDQWKSKIIDLLSKSALVLIKAGSTPGLGWELSASRKECDPRRLVIAIPAHMRNYQAFRIVFEDNTGISLPLWPAILEKDGQGRVMESTEVFLAIIRFDREWIPTTYYLFDLPTQDPTSGIIKLHKRYKLRHQIASALLHSWRDEPFDERLRKNVTAMLPFLATLDWKVYGAGGAGYWPAVPREPETDASPNAGQTIEPLEAVVGDRTSVAQVEGAWGSSLFYQLLAAACAGGAFNAQWWIIVPLVTALLFFLSGALFATNINRLAHLKLLCTAGLLSGLFTAVAFGAGSLLRSLFG